MSLTISLFSTVKSLLTVRLLESILLELILSEIILLKLAELSNIVLL